jgi:uncharacterized protein YggL (DUF469 family)
LIEEATRKAMLEPQGTTSKGYFTVRISLSGLLCCQTNIGLKRSKKELIDKWLQDGKLVEIELGKYKAMMMVQQKQSSKE